MNVFLDSGAFLALSDSDDFHHPAAVLLYEKILSTHAHLFTSNYVLAETYTLIRARVSHTAAVNFMKAFEKTKIKVLRVDIEAEEKAKRIFIKYADKVFSFIDCSSFALIDKYRLNHALAFDRHFSQYRFAHLVRILPGNQ